MAGKMLEKMGKYNFDEIVPRRGTNSCKWDTPAEGVLPMWVADMDFRTAPCVTEALRRRVEHGIFGYVKVPQSYYDAVIDWFRERHGVRFERDRFICTSGVVPAISAIIKALTRPGDKVIVQPPVYNCFFSSIRNNGCEMLPNRLLRDGLSWRMDFDDLEAKASDQKAKVMILCNPHNPVGRVWTEEELRGVGEICLRNNVFVISDEIHCELTCPGHDYTPFASLGKAFRLGSATCISPSKAFNIAGLQIANIIAEDCEILSRIDRAININEVCDVNPFGVEATLAAYSPEGADWLDELRGYLYDNYMTVKVFFSEHIPQCPVTELEGTYLVWIDISATGLNADEVTALLLDEQKLMVNSGSMYGPGGENFIRLNIACPRSLLLAGLERLSRAL